MVKKFMSVLEPCSTELFVKAAEETWSMEKLNISGNALKNYTCARYACDVTFQQANKPIGNHNEAKRYFSGKHHLYGYKVEVSVLPAGLAINCTKHAVGSTAGITMFRENNNFHVGGLQKRLGEGEMQDEGPLKEQFPGDWIVLVDKGYQGLATQYRVSHPKRKQRGDIQLTPSERQTNDAISSDRVIVENFFGRLKTLWAVCADKWTWDEALHDEFFCCCIALTNLHVRLHPLREEDGDAYMRYSQRLKLIGEDIVNKEKRKAQEQAVNRAVRLPTDTRSRTNRSTTSRSSSDNRRSSVASFLFSP